MRFKYIFVIAFLFILHHADLIGQQVPNGGFEEWELPNTWTETPDGWVTDNGQLIANTVKDSLPNSGDWAMRVYPIQSDLGEYGQAHTVVEISGIPNSLEFYAKWDKSSSTAVGVDVVFMNDDIVVLNEFWSPNSDTSEWIPVSISLSPDDPIITDVRITVYVSIGDLVPGEGWISIDDMHFSEPNGIDQFNSTDLFIGPNPCDSGISINSKRYDQSTNMVVYDSLGHIIHIGKLTNRFDTSALPNGLYTLQIGEGKHLVKERFQVIH